MAWPFKKTSKSFLGVDVGTSAVRLVELSKQGEQNKLKNYGWLSVAPGQVKALKGQSRGVLILSPRGLAQIISTIIKEAKIEATQAFFSLPDFATFFTTFSLPPMSKEEIPQAVRFEARRHVPLPLSEVTLDWLVTKGEISGGRKGGTMEVLLVVVPNATVEQYTKIAEICGLELLALEAEVFGLQRALVKEGDTVGLIDIGAQSTSCSIVDQNIIKLSHSFDIAGNDLTERIAKSLNLERGAARLLKEEQGLLSKQEDIRGTLSPLLDSILIETKKVVESFYQQEGKEPKTYILSGGSAPMLGLKEYFAEVLDKPVEIADPFESMAYPPVLEQKLKNLGPGFATAAGMALKGLE